MQSIYLLLEQQTRETLNPYFNLYFICILVLLLKADHIIKLPFKNNEGWIQ